LAADPQWQDIWRHNSVITYAHNDEVSSAASAIADVRVLWGGDHTVAQLRRFASPPGSRDIAFVDKISGTVINAERYLLAGAAAQDRASSAFIGDAYQFDQLACSSPHFVFFCGPDDAAEQASAAFWSAIRRKLASSHGAIPLSSNAPDKMASAYVLAASIPGAKWMERATLDRLSVMRVPPASLGHAQQRVGNGFFVESFFAELVELGSIASRRVQTLGYFGFSRAEMIRAAPLLSRCGIDRLVPMGTALNFFPIWDGYALLSELTRRVVVQ
jgi:hypothetical protein